jgi:hypothetical protein
MIDFALDHDPPAPPALLRPCAPLSSRRLLSPRSFLAPARDERADPGTHFFTVCAVPPARRRVDGFGEHGAVVLAQGAQRQ